MNSGTTPSAPKTAPGSIEADPNDPVIWATKGISFWALLSAILVKAQPKSILEFGGGRSTTFLADYVSRFGKEGITIDQSELWQNKILNDLKYMKVSGYQVCHVPLQADGGETAWYNFDKVKGLIGDRAFDLVFVDGPVRDGRRNQQGQDIIRKAARSSRLIIVDDVHRQHNMDFFLDLTREFPAESKFVYDYLYGYENKIALAAAPQWSGLVEDCFRFLNVKFARVLTDGPKKSGSWRFWSRLGAR